jgi:hypothetical protein
MPTIAAVLQNLKPAGGEMLWSAGDLARESTAAGSSLDRLGTLSLPKRLPLHGDCGASSYAFFLKALESDTPDPRLCFSRLRARLATQCGKRAPLT